MADVSSPPRLVVYVDVSDTTNAQWRAGIQRVVVQLVRQLAVHADGDTLEVVPLVWLDSARAHRRLTSSESALLDADASGVAQPGGSGAPGSTLWTDRLRSVVRPIRRVLRPVRSGARALLEGSGLRPLLDRLRRAVVLHTRDRGLAPLVEPLVPGAVFLEVDSIWNRVELDRDDLYRDLHERGVHVAALVYDLLPIEHPDWFEAPLVEVFTGVLRAQARHSDLVMSISESTAASFLRWAHGLGLTPPDPVVVTLGADLVPRVPAGTDSTRPGVPVELRGKQFVLMVGTVEPRKNHMMLLDAFELLWADHPDLHLVVVGRAGWSNGATIERLRSHPESGCRLHWLEGADDEQLSALYREATLVAVPSITEGFGLPVIEALRAGVPVVSSCGGALPEAGGELVDYVESADATAWAAAVDRHLVDEDHHELRRRGAAGYLPPTWSETAAQVIATLQARFPPRR